MRLLKISFRPLWALRRKGACIFAGAGITDVLRSMPDAFGSHVSTKMRLLKISLCSPGVPGLVGAAITHEHLLRECQDERKHDGSGCH